MNAIEPIDDNSALVQVMAWWRHAPNHQSNQSWPRSMLPYGVTRPQRVTWYSVIVALTWCRRIYLLNTLYIELYVLYIFLSMLYIYWSVRWIKHSHDSDSRKDPCIDCSLVTDDLFTNQKYWRFTAKTNSIGKYSKTMRGINILMSEDAYSCEWMKVLLELILTHCRVHAW